MALAAFWFSLMNVFVKKVSHLPTMELVFFRCSISSLFCFGGIVMEKISWLGTNRKLLLARGLCGTIALSLYFVTLKHMPLGTAVSIQYMSPIFTVIVASFLLKEKIIPVQFLFFIISFIGVIMIKGFDARVSLFYLGVGLVSSIGSAMAYNMIRSLKNKEHPLVVVLHFQLMAAIAGLIFSFLNWQTPVGIEWLYLFLVGATTQLAQMAMTRSLQSDKVANVSIINYTGIIYALVFGYFLFGETHDALAIFGMLLIVGGVILNILFSRRSILIVSEE
jgi:drug/metabolite transporter (DMT)-like permease